MRLIERPYRTARYGDEAGYAKSRPGMTPFGLIRDCRFPSSAAARDNRRALQRFHRPEKGGPPRFEPPGTKNTDLSLADRLTFRK